MHFQTKPTWVLASLKQVRATEVEGPRAGVDYIRQVGTLEALEYNASANNEILTNIRTQPLKNRNQAIQSSTAIAVLS